MIKDLSRFGVIYLEDVHATMIASADNHCPVLCEFHHFHEMLAIRDFE